MREDIFRRASLDRLKSPEQLNEYMRVVRPGVWMVLAAVVLLLLGVIVWGVFGSVESTMQVAVYAEEGRAACFIVEEDIAQVAAGQAVSVEGLSGTVASVSEQAVSARELGNAFLLPATDDPLYRVELDLPGIPDGIHAGKITLESIQPIRFVTQ